MTGTVTGTGQRKGRGRPRRPEVDEAITAAALGLLGEAGFAGLTVEAVAARAGVGKATVYRRWPNRRAILLDVAGRAGAAVTPPGTGSLRDDLVALGGVFAAVVAASPVADIVAEARRDDEVRVALDVFLAARRRPWFEAVAEAADRGELRAGVDHEVLIDAVAGGIAYRSLFTAAPVDPAAVGALVDQVLAGVVPTP